MVTDFLIGLLLLLSAVINILALSAFLATPSLRSTSNRFVINLLIVNVIGCIIVAPSLLFNSNVIRSLYSSGGELISETINGRVVSSSSIPGQPTTANDTTITATTTPTPAVPPGIMTSTAAFNKSSMQPEPTVELNDMNVTSNYSTKHWQDTHLQILWSAKPTLATTVARADDNETPYHQRRPWLLDIVAAIGALSLLLVVGDTYVGVTDPLRYHTRVSASRVCVLIVVVWCSALGFGGTSAFRSRRMESLENGGGNEEQMQEMTFYNMTFRCAYFVCIIFIPFTLVCAMYWGIIREARKNGLRLRHNGSSPLLQSVVHIGGQCQSVSGQQEVKRDTAPHEVVGEGRFTGGVHYYHSCKPSELSVPQTTINPHKDRARHSLGVERSSLRRNKSAQYLTCPACESCEQVLITRSISNQSAYLSSGQSHRKLLSRDHLRTTCSSPDLHRNLLLTENRTSLDHIRIPRRSTKTLGYMNSIRHRLSNASSLFKYREESRAARISILVVIMFLISYIPFGLLVLAEGHDNSFLTTYQQTVLAIFFVVLANIISPLIFAYRNKRVRRGIKRLVSSPGRATAGTTDTGGGRSKVRHNSSLKEKEHPDRSPGRYRNHHHHHHSVKHSPRMTKRIRHTSVDTGIPLLHDNNALLPSQSVTGVSAAATGLESVQRRKLVIFNGRNGQITKVFHPDPSHQHQHLHNQQTVKNSPTQWNIKGCNKDKLLAHKNSCSWTTLGRTEVGGPVGVPTVPGNGLPNQKVTKNGRSGVETSESEPFLRRLRNTSGSIFKSRAMVPQVSNLEYMSKPVDV